MDWNPNVRFWTNQRGYLRTEITRESMSAEYRCLEKVSTPGAEAYTRQTFVIEDGTPGLQEVRSGSRSRRSTAPSPVSREQMIKDTLEQEVGH